MSLRDKVSASSMREKFIKDDEEQSKKKGGGGDKRFLNYYELDVGAKMTVRLLPDGGDSGEYWLEYATHGGNLKLRGLDSVSCAYTSSGEDCSACAHSFDFHNEKNKDEAKRWRRKETYIAQVMVIDSPIEINETEDENPIKLMYLPYSIVEEIKEAVMEKKIGNIIDHDFIIKKTEGKNGYAQYNKSYFDTSSNPLEDDVLDLFENGDLVLFDLSEELPSPSSTDEVDTWLDHAIEVDAKAGRRRGKGASESRSGGTQRDEGGSGEDDEDDKDKSADDDKPVVKVKGSALLNKLKAKEKARANA